MEAYSDEELGQRVATLRRLRELLVQQKAKFENYLTVLDHERTDIESGDLDRLSAHVEIEEAIVSEIFTFQKVIDPMEQLYRSANPLAPADPELPQLKSSLEDLKHEVLKRNAENRGLLNKRMEQVRAQLSGLRNPFAKRASVYAKAGEGSLVDIQG